MADAVADKLKQRIADLEREQRFKDERIGELKNEIDESRELVRKMEEHFDTGPVLRTAYRGPQPSPSP